MAGRAWHTLTIAIVVAPLLLFAALQRFPSLDAMQVQPTGHFWIVSIATLLSGTIGTALALSVDSVRSTRTVYLALGFIAVALIFATHGLGTPGFIVSTHEYPYAVIISAGLSQMVGAVFIALSVMPTSWPGARFVERNSRTIVVVAWLLLFAYLASMMWKPDVWDFIPRTKSWNSLLATVTIGLLGMSAFRYWRAWRLTQLPGQIAMVCSLAFLAEAQLSMYYGTLWHYSWWLYHCLLLVAFCTLIGGWAIEASRAKSV